MPYLMGTAPAFTDASGKVISSARCGDSYNFVVPGLQRVWLKQYKNGVLGYNGPIQVPVANYTSVCNQDEGVYANQVFAINPDGSVGSEIGTVQFTVIGPTGSTATVSHGSSLFGNSTMLIVGGLALFLFLRKR